MCGTFPSAHGSNPALYGRYLIIRLSLELETKLYFRALSILVMLLQIKRADILQCFAFKIVCNDVRHMFIVGNTRFFICCLPFFLVGFYFKIFAYMVLRVRTLSLLSLRGINGASRRMDERSFAE